MWLPISYLALTAPVQEVSIELPEARSYAVSALGLNGQDASGETFSLAADDAAGAENRIVVARCGDGLCPPLAGRMLPLVLSAEGPELVVAGRRIAGTVAVHLRDDGLVLVNRLPLEDYLVATVGSEMPRTFPKEALRAQAVAARTFAMQRKMAHSGEAVHLRSTTLDQVYGGLARESPETRQAVQATAGEVLVFRRQPIEAFFFSSCNGTTRDPSPVFGADYPYLKSVPCPYCRLNQPGVWSLTLSLSALRKRLGGLAVQSMHLSERLPDGRPRDVWIEPAHKALSPEALRRAIGYTALKSADFEVECDGRACHFHGAGYGHGVGMCQWGAQGMALEGKSYRDILAHYYPGAELKKLY